MNLKITERPNAELYFKLDWHELKALIVKAMLDKISAEAGNVQSIDQDKLKIDIAQEMEGSPAYCVGRWNAPVRGQIQVSPANAEDLAPLGLQAHGTVQAAQNASGRGYATSPQALERALDLIRWLTSDPLLGVDDQEITPDNVRQHVAVEVASIRAMMGEPELPIGAALTSPTSGKWDGGCEYDYSHWSQFGYNLPIRHIRIADVKHDFDLFRQILIQLREKLDLKPAPIMVAGYEPVLVARHVMILHDAGFVEGNVRRTLGMEAPLVFATDLTLDGDNFLGALENKQVWAKLKETLSPQELATLPVKKLGEIAVELATAWTKKKLGLDG